MGKLKPDTHGNPKKLTPHDFDGKFPEKNNPM
jgi:hypothetical protein